MKGKAVDLGPSILEANKPKLGRNLIVVCGCAGCVERET